MTRVGRDGGAFDEGIGRMRESAGVPVQPDSSVVKGTDLARDGVSVQLFELQHIDPAAAASGGGAPPARAPLTQFEKGVLEGERRYREQDGARMARQTALLGAAVRQFEQAQARLAAAVEEQVVGLAYEIAQKVIRQCAEERRDLVTIQVREALQRVQAEGRLNGAVQVRVHPRDLPALEEARTALGQDAQGPVSLTITADPSIAPGGCAVETGTRLVDATIDVQVLRLGEALKRKVRHESRSVA
jgi:flagellar biosynthesis/type III secretory pathway protein FliH